VCAVPGCPAARVGALGGRGGGVRGHGAPGSSGAGDMGGTRWFGMSGDGGRGGTPWPRTHGEGAHGTPQPGTCGTGDTGHSTARPGRGEVLGSGQGAAQGGCVHPLWCLHGIPDQALQGTVTAKPLCPPGTPPAPTLHPAPSLMPCTRPHGPLSTPHPARVSAKPAKSPVDLSKAAGTRHAGK